MNFHIAGGLDADEPAKRGWTFGRSGWGGPADRPPPHTVDLRDVHAEVLEAQYEAEEDQAFADLVAMSNEASQEAYRSVEAAETVVARAAAEAERRVGRSRGRLFVWLGAAAALVVLAFTVFVTVAGVLPVSTRTTISDLTQLLAALAGAAGCWWTAWFRRPDRTRRGRARSADSQRREQRAWILLGTACLAWAEGQLVWSWLEIVRGVSAPFPSGADLGFVLAAVLTFLALVSYPSGMPKVRTGRRGVVWVVEVALVAVTLFCFGWVFLVEPSTKGLSGGAAVLAAFYPMADLVNGALVVVALLRSVRTINPMVVLAAGIGAWSTADVAFLILQRTGHYATAQFLDVFWVLGFLLIGLAGFAPGPFVISERPGWLKEIANTLPFVAVGCVIVAATYRYVVEGAVGPVILVCAFGAVGLLLMQLTYLSRRVSAYDRAMETLTRYFTTVPAGNTDTMHADATPTESVPAGTSVGTDTSMVTSDGSHWHVTVQPVHDVAAVPSRAQVNEVLLSLNDGAVQSLRFTDRSRALLARIGLGSFKPRKPRNPPSSGR